MVDFLARAQCMQCFVHLVGASKVKGSSLVRTAGFGKCVRRPLGSCVLYAVFREPGIYQRRLRPICHRYGFGGVLRSKKAIPTLWHTNTTLKSLIVASVRINISSLEILTFRRSNGNKAEEYVTIVMIFDHNATLEILVFVNLCAVEMEKVSKSNSRSTSPTASMVAGKREQGSDDNERQGFSRPKLFRQCVRVSSVY
jgi:hypothetical protein